MQGANLANDLALYFLIGPARDYSHRWPLTGLWVIGLLVGVEMITYGVAWLALSTVAKDLEKKDNVSCTLAGCYNTGTA